MKLRNFISFISLSLCLLFDFVQAAEKPNVVWILSEDNSKHYLNLYSPQGAKTPTIESLAADGLVFEHAFSNAPVCSVARTTVMTGCYLPKMGAQFHRRLEHANMPGDLKMFPYYLRQAGYHCTNNSKTDYNVNVDMKEVWDASNNRASWKDRKAGQPFFHMRTFGDSHESCLHYPRLDLNTPKAHDPERVVLPPHYPQTKTFKITYAHYLDRMQVIDEKIKALVAELKADGVYDNTFIFYFGDHGGALPRSKGYIYDTGLHVPLVVRVPEKFKHLVDFKKGSRVDGFVSFIDFSATTMNLLGVDKPEHMDGNAFLGQGIRASEVNSRNTAFGYADRFDQQYNYDRSVRIGDFKYIRHYNHYYPSSIFNDYRFIMEAAKEWKQLSKAHQVSGIQNAFFAPNRAEALYNLKEDPYELKNLIDEPMHRERLNQLRSTLGQWQTQMPDSGFLPESKVLEEVIENPLTFKRTQSERIKAIVALTQLVAKPYAEAEGLLKASLSSKDEVIRAWAIVTASHFGKNSQVLKGKMKKATEGSFIASLRMSEYLASLELADALTYFDQATALIKNDAQLLIALNTAVYLKDTVGLAPNVSHLSPVKKGDRFITQRFAFLMPDSQYAVDLANMMNKKKTKPKKK